MPRLSRQQIEQIADGVIRYYKQAVVPEKHLCYIVDPTELASLLGFTVDYQYLTRDGSILGETAASRMWITVYDSGKAEMQKVSGQRKGCRISAVRASDLRSQTVDSYPAYSPI